MSVHRLPAVSCPHCGSAANIRQSRLQSRLVRHLFYACQDYECGHTFRAELAITHTVSPSARPSPEVMLPMWRTPPANDNRAAVAAAGA